ncbi:hypothetical protein DFQ04_2757 [Algoriphagus boseongensis]|uniref:Uncharacterized protein n=1 Tax=Algoriphagus boseongensis TaxID=1442587 RepID=A0A4R6T571_9BACT|nr:hypothetical protein [Algoriphagus boseongensis]TDQ16635.1 hypothetical protein DFQ04_2757 [Algoriphagus boseongensis]
MKNNSFLFTFLILMLLGLGPAFGQGAKDITINFRINAEAIFNGGDVAENTSLSDDNGGSSESGNPVDFESRAFASKFINWEIFDVGPNPDGYQIKFLDFPWTGDVTAFAQNPIPGGGRKAKVKVEDNTAGGNVKYTIRFTIRSNATGETFTYQLDPKIRII